MDRDNESIQSMSSMSQKRLICSAAPSMPLSPVAVKPETSERRFNSIEFMNTLSCSRGELGISNEKIRTIPVTSGRSIRMGYACFEGIRALRLNYIFG